ncbi:RNA-binding domain-containing protein [Methanolobus sp. WCC4]|uniref:RNA-binding domain-containing protein n=1 Tax=Methanolobus sp. WCC4 TaxID=3125784 RepID=UPI0030FA4F5E
MASDFVIREKELDYTLPLKESEILELKRSTSELKEAIISIVAMLNKHQEGEIYFGVKDDGTVLGQELGRKTLRDISRAIADNIEPSVHPFVYQVEIEDKKCILVEFSGSNVPYFAYGRAYVRVADEDRRLSIHELENMILEKNRNKLRWDTEVCKDATLDDISDEKFISFMKGAGRLYNDDLYGSMNKLKLLSDGKPTNAAVILFGKSPEDLFPNARLRCAVFAREDTSLIVDMQDFSGNLFYLIEQAEKYVLSNIHVGMGLDGMKRVDVPEIEKYALREAIVNAFCHRDYFEYDSVNVAIFKDRVEIRNKGRLYGGLSVELIRSGMFSERRNELIADIFHEAGLVEKWGAGIRKILDAEPETTFEEVGTQFIVTFKRTTSEVLESETRDSLHEKVGDRVGEKVGDRVGENLTPNQRKIIDLILEDPFISARLLSGSVGISQRKIEMNVAKLKKKGLLRRVGPARGGHWEVIDGE